jgi:hypothetical protein
VSAYQFEKEPHIHTTDEILELENILREKNLQWYGEFNNDPESLSTELALHEVNEIGDYLATVHNLFPSEESRITLSGIAKALVSSVFGHKD